MKLLTLLLIIGIAIVGVVLFTSKESYRFLGGMSPKKGGYHAEPNEDCLQFPGVRQCVLTDGTSGTCVQNGLCVANMLIDLNEENRDIKKPYCVEPTFKENCDIFCNCKAMEGDTNKSACLQNCLSWFSPL